MEADISVAFWLILFKLGHSSAILSVALEAFSHHRGHSCPYHRGIFTTLKRFTLSLGGAGDIH